MTTDNPDIMDLKNKFKEIKKYRKLYSIFDKKKLAYLAIMDKANDAVAIREFEMIVNSDQGIIKKYPQDYKLSQLGKFDEETGELLPDFKDVVEAIEVLQRD